jgi:hypothetical protein
MTHRVLLSLSKPLDFIFLQGEASPKIRHTERSPDVTQSGRSRSVESCLASPSTSLTNNVRCAQADRRKKTRSWSTVLLWVAFLFLSSCASTKQYPAGSFTIDGVMHRTDIEGGCWVFKATDGQSYELTGEVVKDLLRDGLRAEIVVKPRRDLKSICMVGKIVEVIEIKEIQSNSSPH